MSADDVLKLDNQLCFALYSASRLVTRAYKPLLDELGLTYPQYLVMLVLWESDHLTVTALGKKLLLDSGTLTPLLKRLQLQGLLTRERSSKDERQLEVCLTPAGRDLKQQALSVPGRVLCKTDLDVEDAMQTKQMLDRLIQQLV